MQIQEGLQWDGAIDFLILDADSHAVKRTYHVKNKVTNYARSAVAQLLAGQIVTLPSQMELGTGNGTATATDTDLWAPSTGTLKGLSGTQTWLTYYVQYMCSWASTDPIVGTWTEIGLKDPSGNLWAHASCNITVNSGEMLVAQWQVQMLGN